MALKNFSLSEEELRDHVGDTYFSRGEDYYRQGRVMGVAFEVKDGTVHGVVRGGDPKPYRAVIALDAEGIMFSMCTCPMDEACKHVAALGIAAIKEILRFKVLNADSVSAAVLLKNNNKEQSAAKLPAKKHGEKMPDWRAALSRAEANEKSAVGGFERGGEPLGESCYTEVELVFRLEQIPIDPWKSREPVRFALQVRPRVTHPATGKRSFTAVQWKDVRYEEYVHYRQDQAALPPRAEKFLKLFARTLDGDADDESNYSYRDAMPPWANVASGALPLLWPLIASHEEYGVAFTFGEHPSFPIAVSHEPLVTAAVIRDDRDGIVVAKQMLFPGRSAENREPAPDITLYGDPPVFALVTETEQGANGNFSATFFPMAKKYDVATFASLAHPIHVPAKDIPEFAKKFLPHLMRCVPVENFSAQVAIPLMAMPKLAVALSKTGPSAIRVTFGLRYGSRALGLNDHDAAREAIVQDDGLSTVLVADLARHERLRAKIADLARAYPWWRDASSASRSSLSSGISFDLPPHLALEKSAAAEFVRDALPQIAAWPEAEIARDPDVPNFEQLDGEPALAMTLAESVVQAAGDQGDWFDLAAKVTVAGRSATLAEILSALAKGEAVLFLEDGSVMDLAQPFFVKLADLMRQAAQVPDPLSGAIKVSRFQVGWFDELRGLGIVAKQAASWEHSVGALLDVKKVPNVAPPATLKAVLRPYQQEGLSWLAFLRDHHLGGILADDMGLGKTVQTIALICFVLAGRSKKRGVKNSHDGGMVRPFLIVAPTSVVENWDAEITRFAPHLRVVILRAGDRSALYDSMATADVVITSYALLWRDEERYKNIAWDTIVLDEAQQVKNHQSRAYAIIRQLACMCRFALTGTPLENNTMELWSLCSIVAPGLFPPPERFRETFQRPIEKMADAGALAQLRRRVRPFILRRKKEMVEKDLPLKTESVVLLDMPPAQRAIYDLFLQKSRQKILGLLASGGFREHRFEILTALTRLRQLCLHPALVEKKNADAPSAKLVALLEYLTTITAENHKVLVFSQFTSFLAFVREALDEAAIAYAYLDGGTKNRAAPIERFRSDAGVNVFLISLKAGGVGLNLTAADYCILLDPWWNPAVESQAIARAHRIGQRRSVTAYRFIMKDTIEEKVLKLQEKKRHLFEDIIEEGDAFGSIITEDDIRGLF